MKKLIGLLMLLALFIPCMALADMAQDITAECIINNFAYNASAPDALRDHSYRRFYTGKSLVIQAPEGELIGRVEIKWRTINMPGVTVQVQADGQWVDLMQDGPKYAAQYIALEEPQATIRILPEGGKLEICELTVLTPGELPADIQVWQDAPEKVDLMIFSTHPDDEVLWFGGMLPLYAGEMKKEVLVVNAVYNEYLRRLELLDSLWACGLKNYPVILGYPDVNKSTKHVLSTWEQKQRDPKNRTVELIRRYRPDVVALHDMKGEYGHPAHIVFSELGRQAVERAAIAAEHPASAEKWGVWDVPKTYIHFYAENQIRLDWSQPLASFGGKTAIEVATIALDFHISQKNIGWRMERTAEYDNELFGLWRTTVGPDVEKNDLFENIKQE